MGLVNQVYARGATGRHLVSFLPEADRQQGCRREQVIPPLQELHHPVDAIFLDILRFKSVRCCNIPFSHADSGHIRPAGYRCVSIPFTGGFSLACRLVGAGFYRRDHFVCDDAAQALVTVLK